MNKQACGLHFPRSGCALQGATEAARAVEGVVPILHSTAGCSLRVADTQADAWLPGRLSAAEVPSTALLERQIVFGGISRLREQVRNTLKILSGDLYVVIPGCPAGMIGDDIEAIVRELQKTGRPVLKIDAAGYSGTAPAGYAQFAVGMLEDARGKTAGIKPQQPVVNIWGILPGIDPYWEGDLLELTELLEAAGIRVTRLFGFGSGVEEWRLASGAALNLSVSPSGGQVAQWAKQTLGTPYLEIPGVPVGAVQQEELLISLAAALKLDANALRPFLETARARFLHALGHASADYVRYGFQTSFAVVAESARGFGLLRFLRETAGYLPKALILTDVTEQSISQPVRSACKMWGVPLLASDDSREIEDFLMQADPEVIFGSVLEARAAEKAGALLVEYAYPLKNAVILDSGSTGCRGALRLLESLFARQKARAAQERDEVPALRII